MLTVIFKKVYFSLVSVFMREYILLQDSGDDYHSVGLTSENFSFKKAKAQRETFYKIFSPKDI